MARTTNQRGPTLQRLIVSGLAWKGASQIFTQATRILVAVALARILAPHDYGLAALALVFSGFVLIVSDLALGSRLVQRANLTEADRSTAFWTSVGAGVSFSLLGFALSGPIAGLFGQPALKPMIAVLSLSFLFSGISLTQSALLVRSMAFRALEIRQMAATFGGGAVGIAVAAAGYGAWGVIALQLSAAGLSMMFVWRYSSWRPQLVYSLESLRDFAGFSGNVLGTNVLWQLRATTGNFVIGRFIGPSALGAYAIAYNVILVPFNRIAVPLAQVLFPAMAKIQDDVERLRNYWIRSLRAIAAIALPSMLGLVVVAADFTHVVLGDSWRRAVPVIQLLAVAGIFQTLQFLNGSILQAVDRTDRLLRWSAISYAASLTAFVVGLRWGIVGVAASYALASAIADLLFVRATAQTIGLPVRDLARSLAGVTQAAVGMAAALLAARLLLQHEGVGATARFLSLVPLGAALFIALCMWRAPDVVADVRRLRPRRTMPHEQSEDEKLAEAAASAAAPGA